MKSRELTISELTISFDTPQLKALFVSWFISRAVQDFSAVAERHGAVLTNEQLYVRCLRDGTDIRAIDTKVLSKKTRYEESPRE